MVKRYDIGTYAYEDTSAIVEDPTGDYVSFEDYKAVYEDAEKFRALMASARFRVHGGAGIGKESLVDPATNYAHISLDLFTKHGADTINDKGSREYFLGYIKVAVKAYRELLAKENSND